MPVPVSATISEKRRNLVDQVHDNGDLIYSKLATGRPAQENEVRDLVQAKLSDA